MESVPEALFDRLNAALFDRYAFQRELGAGGMATVYLAHDAKHDRQVAVKVLKPELAAVIGGERFLQEIRVTAHLQHPHILALFDSGVADGFLFYVMPYIEGESLRDRLSREKQLPVDEAIDIAKAVASALDYAHRHKVIHRDIKPENILLHDGQPVVADFGIALAVSVAGGTRITETGLSLGTPHYMSPEQATADRELDARSDIYSLGCVLYEMLGGEPPHTGPTVQSIIAKVLTDEPRRVRLVRSTVPPHVEEAVHRALAKLPADRFGTAQQFADALARPTMQLVAPTGPTITPAAIVAAARAWLSAHRRRVTNAAVIGVLLAGAVWGWLRPMKTAAPGVVRFELAFGQGQRVSVQTGINLALSPDGSRLVYAEESNQGTQLLVRAIDQLEARVIAGTSSGSQPFFSPDGEWLGFYQDGKIRKVSLAGGPPITVATVEDLLGASWGPDDVIAFRTGGGISRVSAAGGGVPETVARPDSGSDLRWPDVLPDGKAALVTIFAGLSSAQLAIVSFETGGVTPLGLAGTNPRYVPPGYIVYGTAEQSLLSVPFDAARRGVSGSPVAVLEGVMVKGGGATELAVSRTGTLSYLAGSPLNRLVTVDRGGAATQLPEGFRDYQSPRFSPDGRRIAVVATGQDHDIWVYSLAARTLSRLTFQGDDHDPEWTPDGMRVIFSSPRGPRRALYWQPADGSKAAEVLLASEYDLWAPTLDGAGGYLAFEEIRPGQQSDIGFIRLGGDGSPQPLVATTFNEVSPALSPDGRWLAYSSNESGRYEIYVRPFPGEGGRWQVSAEGGTEPVWAPSGRELVYRTLAGLTVARIRAAPGFEVESRTLAFPDQWGRAFGRANYGISPDGQRFVMVAPASESGQVIVVVNWAAELGGRAEVRGR